MSTITPRQMRNITRDLLNDKANGRENRASRNDGQIIARMVESGTASRAALDAAIDEIERSALPMDHKKEALKVLEKFKADTATGFAAELFSVDESFLQSLAYHGVDSSAKLLAAGSTTAKRELLGQKVGSSEKEIRRICKQADLMRVDGVDGKTAYVLLDAGIDSVPELATRNASNLHDKLVAFEKSREGYVIGFKAPDKSDVEAWVAQAKGLDRKLEFGSAEDSFDSLSLDQRLEIFLGQTDPVTTDSYDAGLVKLFADLGVTDATKAIETMRSDAAYEVANELEYHGVDVTPAQVEAAADYDALIEWVADNIGDDAADAMGNGWAEWKNPEIELFKVGGETVGARINFSRMIDGDHDYYTEYFFDAKEKRIIASATGGYETNTDVSDIGPGDVLSASATSKLLADLQATGAMVNGVGRRNINLNAHSHEGATLTADSFREAAGIRHDNITVRAFTDNDSVVDRFTQGLSAADKRKVEAGIDLLKQKCTNLSVVDVTGGYWGEDNVQDITIAGFDASGNLLTMDASFQVPDDDG